MPGDRAMQHTPLSIRSRQSCGSVPVPMSVVLALTVLCCLTMNLPSVHADMKVPQGRCGPSYKADPSRPGQCMQLDNDDVKRSLHWLASPPKVPASQKCKSVKTVQGIDVCEDLLPHDMSQCRIWSVIASVNCNHYGSLAFEKYWSERGCQVTLHTFSILENFYGHVCEYQKAEGDSEGATGVVKVPSHPNLTIIRENLWGGKEFSAFYKHVPAAAADTPTINVLKVQVREGVAEDLDGVQFSMLSDLFLHRHQLAERVQQVVFTAALNQNTLTDNVGREAEMAWNMWATVQFLSTFASFSTHPEEGRLQPVQFEHLLKQCDVDPSISSYHHSFMRIRTEDDQMQIAKETAKWLPRPEDVAIIGRVPVYCSMPSDAEDKLMQKWIQNELKTRCHPTRLGVACETWRTYDAFVPCPQELANDLAEDYAASMNWCGFEQETAAIPQLVRVDADAAAAFSQPSISTSNGNKHGKVRIAFFFTVYADEQFVRRLLSVLWSPEHYYLLHVDPTGSSKSFKRNMRAMCKEYNQKPGSRPEGNTFLASDVPIVYGASTATILLSKTMAWFSRNTKGWDYFVPVTGSDYPLVPLHRMENILAYQQPAMPFVMAWTPGTSTHIFRLEKSVPDFEFDEDLALSIKAVTDERGKLLGAVPMEYRSTNFGPPLLCNGKKSFYHLDNRRNKSREIPPVLDTQWLFPRDKFHGRAYANWDPQHATPSVDGVWRLWKKSDPATTGAYDKESIDYIANSLEGRKYYHFFKHMLLGSEEHYYVSLLFNWPRTQSFVQTLSAQTVWNTWKTGMWEQNLGFLTHTHFLTPNEMQIMKGFSRRGMFFARKFNTKKTPVLLDMIDAYIHNNATTDAGSMWPGYFDVDITSPGKIWIAGHRAKQAQINKDYKAAKFAKQNL